MIANQTPFPLRSDSAPGLTRIREFLRVAGFDSVTLCRVLRMENMSDLGRVDWGRVDPAALSPAGYWALRVFARGLPTPVATAREICGDEVLAALLASALLRPSRQDPACLVCPVWLYPLAGFVVASDRVDDPDGEPFTPPVDVVFPAIYSGTLRFLSLLPAAGGGDALDLCGGSGIGALVLAGTARESATADLTERSARFADFNARLNQLPVASWCGDLYEPARGRQFDLITAHPPFVPALGPNMVYRDGGESGEEVVRGVVAGLPEFLRPGGTCVILCVARDTGQQTFEQRARDWLGVHAGEFDVIYGLEKILSVRDVIASLQKKGREVGPAEVQQLVDRFQSLDTRQFVYGALFLRRYPGETVPPPARFRITSQATAHEFERLLHWRRQTFQPGFLDWLAHARPRLSPHLQLTVRHVVEAGSLVPAEFTFEINAGVQAALRPDAWVVPLLARLEGQLTVAEIYGAAQAADELPANFQLANFIGLVQTMIERGFLEIDLPPN